MYNIHSDYNCAEIGDFFFLPLETFTMFFIKL